METIAIAAFLLPTLQGFLSNAVPFILLIGLLVLVHEWGHYVVARLARMKVESFFVGFPPALKTWKRNDIEFGIGTIPLGGYVKIAGMNLDDADHPQGFGRKSVPARMAVLLAGCGMNWLLAIVVLAGVFALKGLPERVTTTRIVNVEKGKPAQRATLRSEDVILAMDGKALKTGEEATRRIRQSQGQALRFTVQRGKRVIALEVTPAKMMRRNEGEPGRVQYGIGVAFAQRPEFRRVPLGAAVRQAAVRTYQVSLELVQLLWQLPSRLRHDSSETLDTLGGPVQIVRAAGESARMGAAVYFLMMAELSINLAVFNLLPWPALDGGRILLLLYGGVHRRVFRRPLDHRKEFWLNAAGLAMLLILILVVTAKDIGQWVGGG